MKFLHAADLHLDAQLKGLEAYEGAPVARIRNATRVAFENVVALAIREKVAFVVLAGDLFDGKWTDQQTGLWTAGQFRRLEREGIKVYLLRGNHDAAAEVRQSTNWPANVSEFPVDRPGSFVDEQLRVALHGQGFSTRETQEDLAKNYPPPVAGLFNIGVLHTSLMGDPQHDSYAPCREETLVNSGYDYWALGHIHSRRVIRSRPWIGYSGCTQGRHIQERGAKGCLIVNVDGRSIQTDFHATDTLRWHLVEIELQPENQLVDLYEAVRERLFQCQSESEGRFSAVRIVIRGRCECHQLLSTREGSEDATAEVRNLANSLDEMWVEKVIFETTPPVDVERLKQGQDLLGELLREIEGLIAGPDTALLELSSTEFTPLITRAMTELREADIQLTDPTQVRHWLKQAEGILISRLSQ